MKGIPWNTALRLNIKMRRHKIKCKLGPPRFRPVPTLPRHHPGTMPQHLPFKSLDLRGARKRPWGYFLHFPSEDLPFAGGWGGSFPLGKDVPMPCFCYQCTAVAVGLLHIDRSWRSLVLHLMGDLVCYFSRCIRSEMTYRQHCIILYPAPLQCILPRP